MFENDRHTIILELARHTGKIVPARFIHKTYEFIPHIERFHNLIAGIYKPAWSDYALSIVMRRTSPYDDKDEVLYLPDGRWLMTYSPRTGGMAHHENRSLMKCMDAQVPIAVFYQETNKYHKLGSTYRVLGLGLISSFDIQNNVFVIEGIDQNTLSNLISAIPDEATRYEIRLYTQISNEFQPFILEGSPVYLTESKIRNRAFRQIVVREYDYACAICGLKFQWEDMVEATAAHIIPKHLNGTDDPRNGISLCHTHHWAFDKGLFSVNENYEVLISSELNKATINNFPLMELSGSLIRLPKNNVVYPHPEALTWHQKHMLKK